MQVYSMSQGKVIEQPDQTTQSTTGGVTGTEDVFKKAMLMDLLTTGGKNISKLSTYSEALKPTEESKTVIAKKEFNDSAVNYSQKMLNVINNKNSYADPQLYKNDLNAASSQLAAHIGFGIGGKVLSDAEKALLQPQIPNFAKSKTVQKGSLTQRLWGGLTGAPVPQTEITKEELVDSEEQLRNKANYLLKSQGIEPPVAPQATQGGQGANAMGFTQQQIDEFNPNLGENIVRDVGEIIKGLPGFGRKLLDITPAGPMIELIQGKKPDPLLQVRTIIEMGAGIVNNLGETIGVTQDEEGNTIWDPKAAFVHDWQHPVDTALWLLPFIKSLKGSRLAKTDTILDQAIKDSSKVVKTTSKAGKSARSVATIVPESLIKSEEIMGKALRYTKSNSLEGMAKELEMSIPVQGNKISNWAIAKDTEIGMMPASEVVTQVMGKVNKLPAAKANPGLALSFQKELIRQLEVAELPGGMKKGDIWGTNMSGLNKTRIYYNSGKRKWFEQGQPVGTPTNDLISIENAGAMALKEIMAEADKAGVIKDALDRQTTAFEVSPVLSKMVSRKGTGISAISLKWSLIRKAWEATAGKAIESAKIGRARGLQGGEAISPEAISQTLSNPVMDLLKPPQVRPGRIPLEPNIIENMLLRKGPAQQARLINDVNYKPGTFMDRLTQEKLLRQANMRKYK